MSPVLDRVNNAAAENSTLPAARPRHLQAVRNQTVPASAATIFTTGPAEWVGQTARTLLSLAVHRPVSIEAATRCIQWLVTISEPLRAPSVSIGDDRTIMLEWDRSTGVLAVLFDDRGDEWYYEGPDGEEIEMPLRSRQDLLESAMIRVAAASTHPVRTGL